MENAKKTSSLFFYLIILGIFIGISGCGNGSVRDSEPVIYTSFRDVPGVTEEEIHAVQVLLNQGISFVYGALPGTESFNDINGEIGGFTALFCRWLSELFGISFIPELYEWNDLLLGLESGVIDFTGELTDRKSVV